MKKDIEKALRNKGLDISCKIKEIGDNVLLECEGTEHGNSERVKLKIEAPKSMW